MSRKKRNQSSWSFIYYVSSEGDIVPYELDSIGCHKKKFKKLSKRPVDEIYKDDITVKSPNQNNEIDNIETPSENHKNEQNNKNNDNNAKKVDQSKPKEDEIQSLNSNSNKMDPNENNPNKNNKNKNQIDQSNVKNNVFKIPDIIAYRMNQKEHKINENTDIFNFNQDQIDYDYDYDYAVNSYDFF